MHNNLLVFKLCLSSLTLGLCLPFSQSVVAQPSGPRSGDHQGSLTTTEVRPGFQLYQHQNTYTIEYPETWYAENSSGTGTIWNQHPTGFLADWPDDIVKTEIAPFSADLDTVMRSFFIEATITKRGDITIGGFPALRVWAFDELGTGIHTLVNHPNGTTIVVSSYYESDAYIDEIQDIHWSLRLRD